MSATRVEQDSLGPVNVPADKLWGAQTQRSLRCIKLWTGTDQKSHFEEGFIDLEPGVRGDALSVKFPITSASFDETDTDPKLGWHPDPARQLVITLSGILEFETSDGRFALGPGDILFTEVSRGIDKWLWFVEAHLQAER